MESDALDQLDVQFSFGILPEWWLGEGLSAADPTVALLLLSGYGLQAAAGGIDLEIRDCRE